MEQLVRQVRRETVEHLEPLALRDQQAIEERMARAGHLDPKG